MTDDRAPDDLPRRYVAQRMSIRALVSDTGIPYGTIRRRLLAAGVELRSKGGQERSKVAENSSDQG